MEGRNGYFICIEGPDGSGKGTVVRALEEYLKRRDVSYINTREPGGTAVGEKIRDILLSLDNDIDPVTEAYLFAASRAQHVRKKIRPALEEGKVVLCDRFVESSYAYQGFGRELGVDAIIDINRQAVDGTFPDLTIILEVEVEIALERRLKASSAFDRIEQEQIDFHKRLLEGYRWLKHAYPDRVILVDASQSADQVIEQCINILNHRME